MEIDTFLTVAFYFGFQVAADEKSIIDDTITKIVEITANVKKLIVEGIATLFEKLSNFVSDMRKTGKELINEATKSITIIINTSLAEINTWVEIAKNKTIDVTECIGDNLQSLKDLPVTSIVELNKCLGDNFERAQYILDDSKEQMQKFLYEAEEILLEMKNCGKNLICLSNLFVEAGKMTVSIAASIAKVSGNAIQTMVNVRKDINICVADTSVQVTVTAGTVTLSTVKCIKNQIPFKE